MDELKLRLQVFVSVPILLSALALATTWIPRGAPSKLDPMKAVRIA